MDRKMREKTTYRSYSYVQKLIEWLSAIHSFYWWPMTTKREEWEEKEIDGFPLFKEDMFNLRQSTPLMPLKFMACCPTPWLAGYFLQ